MDNTTALTTRQSTLTGIFQHIARSGFDLTVYQIQGKPAVLARELGRALGYAGDGKRLLSNIRKEWASDMVEDHDYTVLVGDELRAFKDVVTEYVTSRAPSLTLLFWGGVNKVLLLSRKPEGAAVRDVLAHHGMPELMRQEAASLPAPADGQRLALLDAEARNLQLQIQLEEARAAKYTARALYLKEQRQLPGPAAQSPATTTPTIAREAVALRAVWSWAQAHNACFIERVPVAPEPEQGWFGVWRKGDRWDRIGFEPRILETFLASQGYDPAELLRLWKRRGWMVVCKGKPGLRYPVQTQAFGRRRYYVLRRTALDRVGAT